MFLECSFAYISSSIVGVILLNSDTLTTQISSLDLEMFILQWIWAQGITGLLTSIPVFCQLLLNLGWQVSQFYSRCFVTPTFQVGMSKFSTVLFIFSFDPLVFFPQFSGFHIGSVDLFVLCTCVVRILYKIYTTFVYAWAVLVVYALG